MISHKHERDARASAVSVVAWHTNDLIRVGLVAIACILTRAKRSRQSRRALLQAIN